jgi:3'-phosphoadenosine 5'-phosphosulfate sulfotransferase (PAPS reductase)/FAD synthetase
LQRWCCMRTHVECTGVPAWLAGRPVFASLSGGKDSTALGLWLRKLGVPFTPVFLDTGWEHPATYEYIEQVLVPLFGEFVVLRNEKYWAGEGGGAAWSSWCWPSACSPRRWPASARGC